jgi:hypothetical protein
MHRGIVWYQVDLLCIREILGILCLFDQVKAFTALLMCWLQYTFLESICEKTFLGLIWLIETILPVAIH